MIHTNLGFRLSAYLNKFDCSVAIAEGPTVHFDEVAYTEDCVYKMDHMVHAIWAAGSTKLGVMKNTVGLLRVEYRLFSFEGQGASSVIEQVVPVLPRGTAEQRFGARYRNPV